MRSMVKRTIKGTVKCAFCGRELTEDEICEYIPDCGKHPDDLDEEQCPHCGYHNTFVDEH